jgi:hypothetical protein
MPVTANMRMKYSANAAPTANQLQPAQITPRQPACRMTNGMQRTQFTPSGMARMTSGGSAE